MDVEEAFQVVGEFGAYQKRAVAVLVLTQVYMACQSMPIVVVGSTPEYRIEQLDGVPSSQQEFLQCVIFTEDMDTIVTEDSQEDELSTCNESTVTEPSFIDENLVFNETNRLPFFKHKKGGKKETKIPSRSKVAESEAAASPQRSRLPLRCQN